MNGRRLDGMERRWKRMNSWKVEVYERRLDGNVEIESWLEW